jgi:hypothetical protein
MIKHLTKKDTIGILNFVNTFNDFYQDCYITKNKDRLFLRNNLKLIEKLLKYQEIYAIVKQDIEGLMIIYREKGYRPYAKILCRTEDNKDLIKYLKWNFLGEIFIKIKEKNSLLKELANTIIINKLPKYIAKEGFSIIGLRGKEILIKKNKQLNKEIRNVNRLL